MGANTINQKLRDVDSKYGGIKSDLSLTTGYDLDIESGATLSIAGTAITSSAADLSSVYLTTTIDDISTASSTGWVVSPVAGTLVQVQTVIDTAITVGDAVLTTTTPAGAVTATHTIATAGSAAGTVDTSVPADNNTIVFGDAIKIVSNGGSTDASKAIVTFKITL